MSNFIGQYAMLINGGDWCVVDFRGTKKKVRRNPHPHTYHVCFTKDRTRVKIYRPSGIKEVLNILGDEVCYRGRGIGTHFNCRSLKLNQIASQEKHLLNRRPNNNNLSLHKIKRL